MDTTSSRLSYLSMTGIDDLEVVKSDVLRIDASLNTIQSQVSSNISNIASNVVDISLNTDLILDLSNNVLTNTNDITTNNTLILDLSTNVFVLTNTTIPNINNTINDLSGSHYDLSNNHTALENIVVDLSGNVALNVSNLEDISGLVQTNISNISSHNTRISAVESTLQDLEDELDDLDDDGAGGSVFDAIFGAGTVVSLATVATLALNAYNLAVTANATNATQALEIDALELSRQIKLVDSQFPTPIVETNQAGIYDITSSGTITSNGTIDANTITASSTITGNSFTSNTGYAVADTQITPSYIDLYSTTTTISGETININGNTAVNINGNINLNGGNITGVNTLGFSGSSITGLDTLNFKTASGASASISNLKSVAGDNFSISNGDATFGSKTISTLQTATQVSALITTAINNLVGNAGDGYNTLVELQNEIQNNDVSLNEVFTNVATKVSKSGDTMTGTLTVPKIQMTNTQNTNKICLWSDGWRYSIGMTTSGGSKFGGLYWNVMYFTMNDDVRSGFLWRDSTHASNGSEGAMSLTTDGKLTIASNTRIGYGETTTTAPSGAMLDVSGDLSLNGHYTQTVSGADNNNQVFIQTNKSFRRSSEPHHIDTYNHGTLGSGGRRLYLNYYSNSDVSVGGNSGGNLICYNDLNVSGDSSIDGVLHLNSDGLKDEKFMDWNYYGGRLYEFNSTSNGVNIVSKTNGKTMNWIDPYGNGMFTILNTGTGTANEVISRCPFKIDSPVRADLDMKMVCGSSIYGITENKIYLKSGNDDGGATYLQYQDGTNAVEGVEIYVKDTASSQNRVAQFQEDIIVLEKDVSVLGEYKQGSNPLINVCFIAYQADPNPSANSYINLHFLHPYVDSQSVGGIANVSLSHRASGNAIYNACFPYRFKLSAIVLMYDNDGNTNSTNIRVQVNSSANGNGTLTDYIISSSAKASSQRTQVIKNFTHIAVASGCFKAQLSASTSTSPETSVYFYGYQY